MPGTSMRLREYVNSPDYQQQFQYGIELLMFRMVNMSREEIKSRFRHEAIEHGKAIANGDYIKANKLHKKLQVLYNKAKEQNEADVFSELLQEADVSVRLWASTFSLKVFPDLAEQSLKNLSELSSIFGLSAKATFHLWKEGKLDLP